MARRTNLVTLIAVVAVGLALAGCGDDPITSGTDTVDPGDTVPLFETGGDASGTETSTPEDTSTPSDTSAPPDTSTPPDTSAPPDTSTPEDTSAPQDTSTPADTSAPQDTSAPADTVADTSTPADTVTDTDTSTPADTVTDTSTPQDTAETDVGPDPDPIDDGLNASWIGGACESSADCDHPAFNEAEQCVSSGFPNGFCTQSCRQSTTSGAWICPDADTGAATPFTTTRCISANGAPRCVAECDFQKSETGCRPGYACVLRSRHGQAQSIFPVCLPEPIQRWPGEPEPADDVGESCNTAADCAHRSCMSLPGGYCTKSYCDTTGCPDGSTCYGFSGGETFCLQDCQRDSECREAEGYACDIDATCWPTDNAPSWNPSVGAADCLSAWGDGGDGLSRCDTSPDDYVVLRKSARNLALCNRGSLVESYQMGLGFAPIGDKQVEGDGKTPEGVFYIPQLVPNSDYYKAFLVSYPDKADATRGIAGGIITQAQKSAIDQAQDQCGTPPQSTGLGGWIEIHGEGGDSDWTLGCAALDNEAIDVLWARLGVRDTIVILP